MTTQVSSRVLRPLSLVSMLLTAAAIGAVSHPAAADPGTVMARDFGDGSSVLSSGREAPALGTAFKVPVRSAAASTGFGRDGSGAVGSVAVRADRPTADRIGRASPAVNFRSEDAQAEARAGVTAGRS